jgi:hypothetical protein
MSTSNTQTQTFTVADIRKVVDKFSADYCMIGESTGLATASEIEKTAADLKVFAEERYLVAVTLILRDIEGKEIRGAKYSVSTSATGWSNDQPGNALWPKTTDGSLSVTATLNSTWWDKTDEQKSTFRAERGMNYSWQRTDADTSLSSLTKSSGQQYSSHGYGMERTNYS